MRYFYDPDVPWYMTQGIDFNMDRIHQEQCIRSIEDLKLSGVEPDYLQVFKFSYDALTNMESVVHTQEEPDYQKIVQYSLPEGVRPFSDKVYVIDDVDHRTILLASEY